MNSLIEVIYLLHISSIFPRWSRPSVCLSVCLSVKVKRIVTKRKKLLPKLLHHKKSWSWARFNVPTNTLLVISETGYDGSNDPTNSVKALKTFITDLPQEKWSVETTTCTWHFAPNWPRSSKNADFQSIFARSASAVISKKVWKSSTRFPMSLIWTAYIAPKRPKRGL